MYPIHSSQERFESQYEYPEGVSVTNVPYDGTPFSAHTVLSKGSAKLAVQFGTGGYYSDTASEFISRFFELSDELESLKNTRISLTASDYEDISDLYQKKLELGWAIRDAEAELESMLNTR